MTNIRMMDRLTAGDSTILFRRRVVGVDVGEDEFDFVNGGTSENRRVGLGDDGERNNVFIFNLSMETTSIRKTK